MRPCGVSSNSARSSGHSAAGFGSRSGIGCLSQPAGRDRGPGRQRAEPDQQPRPAAVPGPRPDPGVGQAGAAVGVPVADLVLGDRLERHLQRGNRGVPLAAAFASTPTAVPPCGVTLTLAGTCGGGCPGTSQSENSVISRTYDGAVWARTPPVACVAGTKEASNPMSSVTSTPPMLPRRRSASRPPGTPPPGSHPSDRAVPSPRGGRPSPRPTPRSGR